MDRNYSIYFVLLVASVGLALFLSGYWIGIDASADFQNYRQCNDDRWADAKIRLDTIGDRLFKLMMDDKTAEIAQLQVQVDDLHKRLAAPRPGK